MPGGRATVVVYDRHPMWVAAIAAVLRRLGHDVVAATGDADEAIAALEEHRAELFLLDPAEEEEEAALRLIAAALAASPRSRVVALASTNDPTLMENAFATGVAAFVLKTATEIDIDAAVQLALTSAIHIGNGPTGQAVGDAPAGAVEGLTRREVEILRLVAAGLPNAVLARRLWVTEQTIKFHLSNIYRKLGVQNRTAAAHWALVHGLSVDDHEDEAVPVGTAR